MSGGSSRRRRQEAAARAKRDVYERRGGPPPQVNPFKCPRQARIYTESYIKIRTQYQTTEAMIESLFPAAQQGKVNECQASSTSKDKNGL
jgi:hypothetical protein